MVMLELKNSQLVFTFPQVHEFANFTLSLHRTFRIPDDNKSYGLPPSHGHFPVKHVDDFKNQLPPSWVEHGGVFFPMYQSEAMWMGFATGHDRVKGVNYPFAIKIATGKVSAITGEEWKSGLSENDYCVCPDQKWLDGYSVDKGKIRQFVSTPFGSGTSVEKQITGKEEVGGIQIEVFPMKLEEYNKRFPTPSHDSHMRRSYLGPMGVMGTPGPCGIAGSVLRGVQSQFGQTYGAHPSFSFNTNQIGCSTNSAGSEQFMEQSAVSLNEMSMSAGGMMDQQIFKDQYGKEVWDTANSSRCFIHAVNSMTYRMITGSLPPTIPMTAKEYEKSGLPWFDYYKDLAELDGAEKFAQLKSVAQINPSLLPENQSVNMKKTQVLSEKPSPNKIREGSW